uniref:Uncharacterized protein n=1 Tax=Aegilops tauschii TaxID=37682 RepID=N1QZI4_AEGTA
MRRWGRPAHDVAVLPLPASAAPAARGCQGVRARQAHDRVPRYAVADGTWCQPSRILVTDGSCRTYLPTALSRDDARTYKMYGNFALKNLIDGSAYPNHDVDMVPIRTSHTGALQNEFMRETILVNLNGTHNFGSNTAEIIGPYFQLWHDLHVRQHSMIPQNFARRAPSSSSEHDEPFSYWNMGRFQRSTTTSSISQVAVEPGNFVKKRNADSNSLLPPKFRKLSGAG